MRHIGSDIHQMRDAIAALTLGIPFKEFADLEEKHDKNGLRKLRLCPWQEADAEGTCRSNRHEEMLVEGITLCDSLPSLMQRLVANN